MKKKLSDFFKSGSRKEIESKLNKGGITFDNSQSDEETSSFYELQESPNVIPTEDELKKSPDFILNVTKAEAESLLAEAKNKTSNRLWLIRFNQDVKINKEFPFVVSYYSLASPGNICHYPIIRYTSIKEVCDYLRNDSNEERNYSGNLFESDFLTLDLINEILENAKEFDIIRKKIDAQKTLHQSRQEDVSEDIDTTNQLVFTLETKEAKELIRALHTKHQRDFWLARFSSDHQSISFTFWDPNLQQVAHVRKDKSILQTLSSNFEFIESTYDAMEKKNLIHQFLHINFVTLSNIKELAAGIDNVQAIMDKVFPPAASEDYEDIESNYDSGLALK